MSENNETRLTSEEEKLILQLNQSNIKELKPLISPDGALSYPELKDLAKGLKIKQVQHHLAGLAEKGFLKETGKKSIILCPRCSSHKVLSDESRFPPVCRPELPHRPHRRFSRQNISC